MVFFWVRCSRVLRPPGGGSNISLGADEEKPPVRKNKMASSVFAEPEDPYANRRNNPPGTVGSVKAPLGKEKPHFLWAQEGAVRRKETSPDLTAESCEHFPSIHFLCCLSTLTVLLVVFFLTLV